MTTVTDLIDLFEAEAARDRPTEEMPDVGIIMGSDSDLDVMAGSESGRPGAFDALTALGFEECTDYDDPPESRYTFETWVVSAHRTPELMYTYAETAADRGLDVIIAGAGGKSADLPNMTASIAYPLPVIGVPVQEKSVDSVIGMPHGAPLTAVDAGKSYNAALSAVQILARGDDELADRLRSLHDERQTDVATVSWSLHDLGTNAFSDSR
ncbi:5-(carboxyamino)imidazole ribonucleotide mutase [Halanaeroarchaeum sulfurireducens]|uniref:N5-carboxyaminoimidazole ribonucleotide mutase n=1 Tax=Halanaeroarchaeum sulfurireducens TaxID=1604004 RepID=A0A0F7PEI9_9EURY|nr:5-(carboxyamino)imidazole ribonucleotide mutase [Halanaeroarchaeum sulfurireducens]AKH97723.1 phosphoribosylaminoimidazole carboxylase, catalytic subunit [Halanaeroarchaeum sulfurireducens]ALG82118.1 phosphoribosylaminoimidazole carboxylase, catalytic subunit [Halanaeroarchaeum sulfurireducens]